MIIDRFENAKQRSSYSSSESSSWQVRCPCHDDKTASLTITKGRDKWLVHCHAGCDVGDILAAVGLSFAELNIGDYSPISSTYEYFDGNGVLLYTVHRGAGKKFLQQAADGSWSLKGVERTLYRLPELLAADPAETVYICEGEKDVDCARRLGGVATCNSGGAGKWLDSLSHYLAGRRVVVVPDNDGPGRAHGEKVAASLTGIAKSVEIANIASIGSGGRDKGYDLADFVGDGGTLDDLTRLTRIPASPASPASQLEPLTEVCPELPGECLLPPGLIGNIARWNLETAMYPQPELALAGALALMSVLTGRKVADNFNLRTNLFIVAISPSRSGKDHARVVNMRLLDAAESHSLLGHPKIASDAGLAKALDTDHALLFQLDEIGRFLEAIKVSRGAPHLQGIVTLFNELYSSAANPNWRGKAYADGRDIAISDPHAVIYGTTTPEAFWDSLTERSVQDGFVSRLTPFLGCYVDPVQFPAPVSSPPGVVVAEIKEWANYSPPLVEFPDTTAAVYLYSDAAAERAYEHALLISQKMRTETSLRAAIWGEANARARKFALLFACSRGAPQCISLDDLQLGIKLSNAITRRVIWQIDEEQLLCHNKDLLKKVNRVYELIEPGMTRRDITRKTQWLSGRDREDILSTLAESGKIDWIAHASKSGPQKYVVSKVE